MIRTVISITELGLSCYKDDLITISNHAFETLRFRVLNDGTKQIIDNMLSLDLYHLNNLKREVSAVINRIYPDSVIQELRAFVNLNGNIDFDNDYHNHPGFDVGGVYYLHVPGNGGELEFANPKLVFSPVADHLVLFDSDYNHKVNRYQGESRYSIGINVRFF